MCLCVSLSAHAQFTAPRNSDLAQGFILQRLVGDGLVLLKGGGATIVRQLQPGEVLRVLILSLSLSVFTAPFYLRVKQLMLATGCDRLDYCVPDLGAL